MVIFPNRYAKEEKEREKRKIEPNTILAPIDQSVLHLLNKGTSEYGNALQQFPLLIVV